MFIFNNIEPMVKTLQLRTQKKANKIVYFNCPKLFFVLSVLD